MFVGVTAEKLVRDLFAGGTKFIQMFYNGKIYLIGEHFVGKSFRWGKFLSPSQHFLTFPRRKVFAQI